MQRFEMTFENRKAQGLLYLRFEGDRGVFIIGTINNIHKVHLF